MWTRAERNAPGVRLSGVASRIPPVSHDWPRKEPDDYRDSASAGASQLRLKADNALERRRESIVHQELCRVQVLDNSWPRIYSRSGSQSPRIGSVIPAKAAEAYNPFFLCRNPLESGQSFRHERRLVRGLRSQSPRIGSVIPAKRKAERAKLRRKVAIPSNRVSHSGLLQRV